MSGAPLRLTEGLFFIRLPRAANRPADKTCQDVTVIVLFYSMLFLAVLSCTLTSHCVRAPLHSRKRMYTVVSTSDETVTLA